MEAAGGSIALEGVAEDDFANVQLAFKANFSNHRDVGASLCVYHRGKKVVDMWGGHSDADQVRPWKQRMNTLLRDTGNMVSNLLIAMYVAKGRIEYDKPVADYWPEFAENGKENITVSQLLSHQAGLHGYSNGNGTLTPSLLEDGEKLSHFLANQKPQFLPAGDGKQHAYHTLTIGWYVNELIRKIDVKGRDLSGHLLDKYSKKYFGSLGVGLKSVKKFARKSFVSDAIDGDSIAEASDEQKKKYSELEKSLQDTGSHLSNSLHPWGLVLSEEQALTVATPSVNMYTNARSLSEFGNLFVPKSLGGGGKLNLSTLQVMATECTSGSDLVLDSDSEVKWTKGGFFSNSTSSVKVPSIPSIPNLVFYPGFNGSVFWLDPTNGVVISYLPNVSLANFVDSRASRIIKAVYSSITVTDNLPTDPNPVLVPSPLSESAAPDSVALGSTPPLISTPTPAIAIPPGTSGPPPPPPPPAGVLLATAASSSKKGPSSIFESTRNKRENKGHSSPQFESWSAKYHTDGTGFVSLSQFNSFTSNDGVQSIYVGDILRSLTSIGKQESSVPLLSIYLRLGTLRMIQRGIALWSEYKSKLDSGYKFTEIEHVHERLTHKYFIEIMSGIGFPVVADKPTPVITGLDSLILFIEDHYSDTIEVARTLIQEQKANINSFLELYHAGDIVEGTAFGLNGHPVGFYVCDCYFEVEKSMFESAFSFHLVLQCIASVGDTFTAVEFVEVLSSDEGETIHSIPSLAYRPASEATKASFLDVGTRYSKFAVGHHYVEYKKNSFSPHSSKKKKGVLGGGATNSPEGGRIMLDTDRAYSYKHTAMSADTAGLAISKAFLAYKNLKASRKSGDQTASSFAMFSHIPPAFQYVTWPAVVGFSFTLKQWGHVLIGSVDEVKYNIDSFKRLVLPPKRKEILEAIVTQHASTTFSSVISGKGEGAIFLLHGPPGTGKTLTCEAVSELLHRPLYSVSMGELGISPGELEENLQRILSLCASWDTIVLLDDADIYVERRGKGNILRNSMVGVILRLTEYFRGVLFFTTNRVTSFDPAFRSRVTLAIRYRPLSSSGRAEVWENVLKVSGGVEEGKLASFNFEKLAQIPLNGRQITSAVQLALALGKQRGRNFVGQKEIEHGIGMLLDFDEAHVDAMEAADFGSM